MFVTSNSKLAYTFRDYILENEDNSRDWSSHALPVISDNMLLYRIWLPFASESSKMPSLTLARFANAAQSEGDDFFEKIRQKASEMESIEHIDLISMPEVARRKFEDILIAKSDGDLELLDDEIVAVSYDECLKMAHRNLLRERNDYKDQAEKFKTRTVELLAQKYIDKLGWWKVLLVLAKWWWIPSAIVLYVASEFITKNTFVSNAVLNFAYKMCKYFQWNTQLTHLCTTTVTHLISLVPILIYLVQLLYDKIVDDKGLRFSVYKRALRYVKSQYVKKIKIELRSELCVDDVVLYCLERTKEFTNAL